LTIYNDPPYFQSGSKVKNQRIRFGKETKLTLPAYIDLEFNDIEVILLSTFSFCRVSGDTIVFTPTNPNT
jgi:hypothetical protein